jgi:hypothetical protein
MPVLHDRALRQEILLAGRRFVLQLPHPFPFGSTAGMFFLSNASRRPPILSNAEIENAVDEIRPLRFCAPAFLDVTGDQ